MYIKIFTGEFSFSDLIFLCICTWMCLDLISLTNNELLTTETYSFEKQINGPLHILQTAQIVLQVNIVLPGIAL